MKLILAGLPLTPVPRIAGAVFRAATDPDIATSGCPWVLPDDGPVIRVEKEALRAGVYEMLDVRLRRVNGYVSSRTRVVSEDADGHDMGLHSALRGL